MRSSEFLSQPPPRVARTRRPSAVAAPLWAVNQRLANAEQELRIQFTRIAQLQAQLDVVLGAIRRAAK